MDGVPKTYKGSFGMKCIKCMLILINVLYLIIAILMICGATTLKVVFGEYYYELWYSSTVDSLSSLWIATGCFLLALSIFGIAAAIKESTMMTNVYGLFLSLIFVLQIAAAITGFTLITQTDDIVRQSMNTMMDRKSWGAEINAMDWVQETFHCCGTDGPSDWEQYGRYTPKSHTTDYTTPYYYDRYYSTYQPETTSTTPPPPTSTESYGNRMPQSCCTRDSSYDKNLLLCQNYFTRGCHGPLNQIVSQSVMVWGSSALFIGIVQIFGVVSAFMFARTIRRNKTNRDINRWAVHDSFGFDRPVYVDHQSGNQEANINTDDVKHI